MTPDRRDFLARLAAGTAATVAGASALPASLYAAGADAHVAGESGSQFSAQLFASLALPRVEWDTSWTSRLTGKHRAVFDSPSVDGGVGVFRSGMWQNQYAEVLKAAGFDVSALKPFRIAEFAFGNSTLTISRTGFTGDLGYELWLDPAQALALWDRLFAAGAPWNIRPIGTDALNLARIEAGFIITNMDFIPADQALREDRPRSPLEMGLAWMIDWDRGHFTGRRALLAEQARGSDWALVGLEVPGNISAEGSLLYHNRKTEAGFITAAAWSPSVKKSIALAQVPARHRNGHNLWVEIYALRELQYVKLMLQVAVVERPFFNPPRKRATPPGRY